MAALGFQNGFVDVAEVAGVAGVAEVAASAQAPPRDPLDTYFETVNSELANPPTIFLKKRTRSLYRAEFGEVAFSTLEKTLKVAKSVANRLRNVSADVFITAEKDKVVLVLKALEKKQISPVTGKKHKLEDQTPDESSTGGGGGGLASTAQDSKVDTVVDDKVLDLIKQLGKSSHYKKDAVDAAELLLRSAGRLKGTSGERALQSFSAAFRKLGSQPHALIVAVSFNSGVCMRLSALKHSCGSAWADGQLATNKIGNFDDVKPPLSEEGQAALLFGNHPLMLLTSMG